MRASLNSIRNKKPTTKVVLIAVGCFIVIALAIFAWHVYQNKLTTARYNKSAKLAVEGKYTDSAKPLIKIYNRQTDPSEKAGTARQIGLNYYYAKDYDQGKSWMETSSTLYKKAGAKDKADEVISESNTLYQLKNIKPTESKDVSPM
jgi:hypothetical protein